MSETEPTPSLQFKEQGNAAFGAGRWREAIAAYTHAIALDPTNEIYYSNRSAAYLKSGDFALALADAEKCIALKPDFHKGHGRKGAALHALKQYDDAIAAYQAGLVSSPDEEHLLKGLDAARKAKLDSSQAVHAARKSTATRRASLIFGRSSLQRSQTVSQFVQQSRMQLKLGIEVLQSQLQLIEELAALSDAEKLEMVFGLCDTDQDGKIGAVELARAIRQRRNGDISFAESIDRAIDTIAIFDKDGDAQLDLEEFGNCLSLIAEQLGTTFHEMSEFLVVQLLSADQQNTLEEEIVGIIAEPAIHAEVKEREALYQVLSDPRMMDLFTLFDKNGSGSLSFKEVAIGLYQITQNMEDAVKTTMELLLMMDPNDDSRSLDYEQFARFMLAIVSATGTTFEEISSLLMVKLITNNTVTPTDLETLLVSDQVFSEARSFQEDMAEASEVLDALSYGRLTKLFDMWDTNKDGSLSFEELTAGLNKFHSAMTGQDSLPESELTALAFMIQGDEDGDKQLDKVEFAKVMVQYAKSAGVPLHEVIDFMCVTALADGPSSGSDYQNAYRQSIKMSSITLYLDDSEEGDSTKDEAKDTSKEENKDDTEAA